MRIVKNILLVLGVLLIIFNTLGYVAGASPFLDETKPMVDKVACFIGTNIFNIFGLIFLFVSFKIHRRQKKKERKRMVETLLEPEAMKF